MKPQSLIEKAPEALTPRFYLVGLLPSAVLAIFVYVLWEAGAPFEYPDFGKVVDSFASLSGPELALLIGGILLFAILVQPFQVALVRVLEGYWGMSAFARTALEIGVELQRRRRKEHHLRANETLDDDATVGDVARQQWAASRTRFYPRVARLMPTQLGNTLRAAEDRAGDRYGLATGTVWPRLRPHLSEQLAGAVTDLRNQLDTAARLCVMFLLAAAISVGMLARHGGRWLVIIPLGALGLAWLSYRATIRAGEYHGGLLETAFDLHRFDLIAALHYPLPSDARREYDFNQQLTRFLQLGEAWDEEEGGRGSYKPREDYLHPAGTTREAELIESLNWKAVFDADLPDEDAGRR
jgi:hypothetical protein